MITMKICDIATAAGGRVIPEKMGEAYVRSVEIDSRKVALGALFLPIIGERVDGHDYIEKAFALGAVCALCNEDKLAAHEANLPYGKALIAVQNTETALEAIAEAYRAQFAIPVVGVTGSVGKTSCKEFVAAVLSGGRKVLKTEGNHNNNIGMPLTLFELDETYEAAVMEMGMDHFGEIKRLSKTARPKVGIITNIGISHMENLGSREGILKAKLEIADFLEKDGILFVNGDDVRLNHLKEKREETIEYFGFGENCDGRILKAETTGDGTLRFAGRYLGEVYEATVNTAGCHMAMNIMPAIMTGVYLGLNKEQILNGLSLYRPAAGRLNILKKGRITVIDDCYNASPDSMMAALKTLAAFTTSGKGRRIAVLGDMYELGSAEEQGHRLVGQAAADQMQEGGLDRLYTVGPMARWIYEEAKGSNTFHYETVEALTTALMRDVREDDCVLVKASHGMALERVVEALLNQKREEP